MIEQNRGVKIDIDNLALDDAETYKLFARGDTTAIFQFESHGMRDILRRYQPTRIEDLTALNALYRPGPIQGGMIDDFINRKHGKTKVSYELPQLQDILEETYGVILYQEQVMQIANRLASFSLGEADILRRAMGKKKKEEMAAQRAKFMAGCADQQGSREKGRAHLQPDGRICRLRLQQIAFLRLRAARVPNRLSQDSLSGGIHGRAAHLRSGRHRKNREVHQRSARHEHFHSSARRERERSVLHARGEAIRFGLAAIKNVGENTAKAIRESRLAAGEFRSLYEFCERIEPRFLNKRVFESLIKSGAMDSLGPREGMAAIASTMP